MKKERRTTQDDEMRAHYDFSGGVRGKYAKRYAEGTNLVLLAPEVYKVFKDADAVNNALRGLIAIAEKIFKRGNKKVAKSA